MGGLPLAIEQAGAYIEATGTPLAEYLALFRSRRSELLGTAADPETPTVAATWKLTFEDLRQRAPAAADLLTIVAFLAPDEIPRQLFAGNDQLPRPLQDLSDPLAFAMSATNPGVAQPRADRAYDTRAIPRRSSTETKASFKTTEFFAYIAVLAGIFIAGVTKAGSDHNDVNDVFRASQVWLYATILSVGYMISRGLAKAGSREPYTEDR